MKYNIGDKVKIKSWDAMVEEFGTDPDLEVINTVCVNKEFMGKYCGTIMTITKVGDGYYHMEEDGNEWYWCDSTIETKMPKTNLDILRSYDVKDLADFILILQEMNFSIFARFDGAFSQYASCKSDLITRRHVVDWLNSESDGDYLSKCKMY